MTTAKLLWSMVKIMLKMSQDEFAAFVKRNTNGVTFVTMDCETDADKGMNKRGNPFYGKGMVKKFTINGAIGYIYSNAVNRQASREGLDPREVKVHPWGDMDEKHLFRVHRETGKLYLSLEVKHTSTPKYFIGETEIDVKEFKQFIKKESVSSTQEDLEKKVIVRDFSLDSICKVRLKGIEVNITSEVVIQEPEVKAEKAGKAEKADRLDVVYKNREKEDLWDSLSAFHQVR